MAWIAVTVSWIGFLSAGLIHFREPPALARTDEDAPIPLPIQLQPSSSFDSLSRRPLLAFTGAGPDGVIKIWVHSLDGKDERPVLGTEKVSIAPPFWSPDSGSLRTTLAGNCGKSASPAARRNRSVSSRVWRSVEHGTTPTSSW